MQETNLRFYLVCDTSASMEYRGAEAWGSKLQCAKVIGAALTWFLLKQNDAAGLLTLSRQSDAPRLMRPSQKPSHLGLVMRELENLNASGGANLAMLLQHASRLIRRRSLILFISDLLEPSEEVASGFKHLKFLGHEIVVFQTLDRDEVEFPFEDGAVFEDLESGNRRAVSPGTVRNQYLERFKTFMAEYLELFRSLEVPHCVVRTDQNPWAALALFLRERRRLL
jgi:uncharacterized protein (DUF58 family)